MQRYYFLVMDEQVILKVLREQQLEVSRYEYSNWCTRFEESLILLDSNLAQVVTGVRRSGKSTLCHKVLLQNNILYGYANMDDDRLCGLQTEDLDVLLGCIYQLYGTNIKYLFFDEIQNVNGWHLFANRLLRQGMRLFITGSNAKLLSGELATHLTGRYNEIKLYPFSFAEYCQYHNVDTSDITTQAESARKTALSTYLLEGGFPEIAYIPNPNTRRMYVESLIETIIVKDISKRFNIRNTEAIRRIANHLINNSCQTISTETLAEIAGLKSIKTVQQYVFYLSQAFLIHRLQKFSFKSAERIRSEKCYVIDTGFISNRDNNLLGENSGWRLENVVYVELLRRHQSQTEDIYYYKQDSRSKEVDFIICRQNIVNELIQVAYNIDDKRTFKRETDALINASKNLNCSDLTLLSLSKSEDVTIEGHTIKIRAITEWLLMSMPK